MTCSPVLNLLQETVAWEDLPADLLGPIIKAGGTEEMKAMRGVCKAWQEGFESSVSQITVAKRGHCLPAASAMLHRFPLLRSLRLNFSSRCSEFQKYDLHKSLMGLPLTRLEISNCCYLILTGLEAFRTKPLVSLRIRGRPVSLTKIGSHLDANLTLPGLRNPEAVLSSLRGKHLTSLDLNNCCMLPYNCWLDSGNPVFARSDGLAVLRGMPIRSLNLGSYLRGQKVEVVDAALEFLGDLPLTGLNLEFCDNLSDNSLGYLTGFALVELNLNGCYNISSAGINHLLQLQRLERLAIQGCFRLKPFDLERIILGIPPLKVLDADCFSVQFLGMQVI